MREISVVVPVYNSAEGLGVLVGRLEPVLEAHADRFELILVNDGSRDHSWKVVQELVAAKSWVRGIDLMRNFGQHNAVLCGVREARFPVTVTMDDDLQHPPEAIPSLLEKLGEGWDVVYGTPRDKQHGFLRNVATSLTKLALRSTMGAAARDVSAFRAFRTGLRDAFNAFVGPFVSVDVLLTWATVRFTSVPVSIDQRQFGKTNYSFRALVAHAMNMMTGFSALPLQVASIVGFAAVVLGFLVLFWVIGRYLVEGSSVPGFPFLASIIAIFSGVQLFALGIFGEYLARMHFRLLEKPTFVVRERLGGAGDCGGGAER